jgi:uncharacterized membrane protein
VFSNVVAPSRKFVKNALLMGVPFGLLMGLLFVPLSLVASLFGLGFDLLKLGLVMGTVCGVLFGVTMAAFAGSQRRRFASRNPCVPGERLLKHGPANHALRGEGVGGYLYLTDGRLLFESHGFNV